MTQFEQNYFTYKLLSKALLKNYKIQQRCQQTKDGLQNHFVDNDTLQVKRILLNF